MVEILIIDELDGKAHHRISHPVITTLQPGCSGKFEIYWNTGTWGSAIQVEDQHQANQIFQDIISGENVLWKCIKGAWSRHNR